MDKRRIAFVILNDPMIFPPTINAAEILAESGYEVDIFALRFNRGGDKIDIPTNVKIHYVGDLKGGVSFRIIFFKMIYKVVYAAIKTNYRWIFSYNMTAVVPGYIAAKISKAKFLYHNHDDTVVNDKIGFYSFLKKMEYACARKANIVSYPQEKRAEDFFNNARLLTFPLIVRNGPREKWIEKADSSEFLSLRKRFERILIYQGGLNWERGIKNIIDIFSKLKGNVGLILIGKTDNDVNFKPQLLSYLTSLNLTEKVILMPVMNYSQLASLTKVCDMGFGVMIDQSESKSYNVRYLAGASNKLVEYMACGLVSIVPDTQDYKKYILDKGIGLTVSPNDTEESAKIISRVLFDEVKLGIMKADAKENFRLNESFDIQFKKVLIAIKNE